MPFSSISEGIVLLDRPFASTGRRLHRANVNEFVSLTVQKAAPLNEAREVAARDDQENHALAQMRLTIGEKEFAVLFDLRAGLQIKGLPVAEGDEVRAATSRPNAFVVYGHRSTEP